LDETSNDSGPSAAGDDLETVGAAGGALGVEETNGVAFGGAVVDGVTATAAGGGGGAACALSILGAFLIIFFT
jgi:hypothetical protein